MQISRLLLPLLLFCGVAYAQTPSDLSPGSGASISQNEIDYAFKFRSNLWLGLNSQPLCVLTDAATIAVSAVPPCVTDTTYSKGIAYNGLTLTASGHVIGCPTGAVTSGSNLLFRINEGTGPFKVSMAGCYYIPPASLDGQGNLVLSGGANGINLIDCQLFGVNTGNGFPVQYECGPPAAGLGSATAYLVGTPGFGSSCSNGVTSCAQSGALVSGDEALIFIGDCGNNANCSTGSLVQVTSVTGTGVSGCTKFTGAEGIGNGVGVHWVYCSVTSTGTLTLTVNWASAVQAPLVVIFDLHNVSATPDAGIGNFATGNSTSPSVTTNGNVAQSNSLVLSGVYPAVSETWTPGAGAATIENSTGVFIQSNVVYAPVSSATVSATMGTSGLWTMSTVQVLHK